MLENEMIVVSGNGEETVLKPEPDFSNVVEDVRRRLKESIDYFGGGLQHIHIQLRGDFVVSPEHAIPETHSG